MFIQGTSQVHNAANAWRLATYFLPKMTFLFRVRCFAIFLSWGLVYSQCRYSFAVCEPDYGPQLENCCSIVPSRGWRKRLDRATQIPRSFLTRTAEWPNCSEDFGEILIFELQLLHHQRRKSQHEERGLSFWTSTCYRAL